MDWYYAENNQQRGPVTQEQFAQLVAQGIVRPDTLVWHDGMENWQSLREVQDAPAGPPPPPLGMGGAPACSQCGRTFSADQMLQYGNLLVCSACQPGFFERVRATSGIHTAREYGGFWIRFVAWFADSFLLGIVSVVVFVAVFQNRPDELKYLMQLFKNMTQGQQPTLDDLWELRVPLSLAIGIQFIFFFIYHTFFVGRYGATPGKKMCGLRIIRGDGSPVSYGLAFGRAWGYVLDNFVGGMAGGLVSAIPNFGPILQLPLNYFPYIMAAFDDEKRALHDRVCNTRVIKV